MTVSPIALNEQLWGLITMYKCSLFWVRGRFIYNSKIITIEVGMCCLDWQMNLYTFQKKSTHKNSYYLFPHLHSQCLKLMNSLQMWYKYFGPEIFVCHFKFLVVSIFSQMSYSTCELLKVISLRNVYNSTAAFKNSHFSFYRLLFSRVAQPSIT